MKSINIFCFGFGQVAKNFIKKLIIEKYNIKLTTTSRSESQKKNLMVLIIIVTYLTAINLTIT